MNAGVKTCDADPSHQWMADLPLCPYCHVSREMRVAMAERGRTFAASGGTKEAATAWLPRSAARA